MFIHAMVWLVAAAIFSLHPNLLNPSLAQLAAIVAGLYLALAPMPVFLKRNPLVRRVKRITTAAKAVRRAL